ncbi:MAG: fatty acid desaturase [Oscillatoriales cyanobacterium]|nr:MAG: fatty acid desaturase [Oscillatoriales cyanobacterium]
MNLKLSPQDENPTLQDTLARDLRDAVRDCAVVSPWRGFVQVGVVGALCLGCVAIAWRFPIGWAFVGWSTIAGILYTFWLTPTHEAIHHTLTGWGWCDEVLSRVIAWPILWASGTYSELHKLHHSWNGRNLDDPERTEWTQAEYDRANGLVQWYIRHQWAIDVFGGGAIGLVLKTFRAGIYHGWLATKTRSRLRWQLALDLAGMVIIHTTLILWVLHQGVLGQYALFWLIVERVVGIIMQCREHVEHYGLWNAAPTPCRSQIVAQLYTTRNLQTTPLINWLMAGLPYHAVHHAFPEIPSYRLPIALARIEAILGDRGYAPLVRDPGYWKTSWRRFRTFSTIAPKTEAATNPDSVSPSVG